MEIVGYVKGGKYYNKIWNKNLGTRRRERTKIQNKVQKQMPPPPPPPPAKKTLADVMTVHKRKRHTVFAALAPKTILYNLTIWLNFVNNNGSFYNSRKRQITEDKESGKTYETLCTQCREIVKKVTLFLRIPVFQEWILPH